MRHWTIKILASCALLMAFTVGTPPGVTPAAAKVRCNEAPTCDGLHGQDRSDCQADRAEAEADCQARGLGDARGDRGHGPKWQDCKDKAAKLRGASPNGRTTYKNDC